MKTVISPALRCFCSSVITNGRLRHIVVAAALPFVACGRPTIAARSETATPVPVETATPVPVETRPVEQGADVVTEGKESSETTDAGNNGDTTLPTSSNGPASSNGDTTLPTSSNGPTSNNGDTTLPTSKKVLRGGAWASPIDLGVIANGDGGFVINGASAYDYSGFSVSGAGDVNGDGLDDIIVGAPSKDGAGRSYVVFGSNTKAPINLSSVAAGTGGFAIVGQFASEQSGFSVAKLGDVNGDGLADVFVGAPSDRGSYSFLSRYLFDCCFAGAARQDAGRSYVIFGRRTTNAVSLSDVAAGNGGFVINGESAGDQSGTSVSGAGDVNGDGLADFVVGAPSHNSAIGRSYVIFGRRRSSTVNLSDVAAGNGGFVINGESVSNLSGTSVSGAGDVNGDGLADLIVGSPLNNGGGVQNGRSYVVFGSKMPAAVNLSAVVQGRGGFAINGAQLFDMSGTVVSGAGDVNGDGLADLLIGAPFGKSSSVPNDPGCAYVVFGKTSTAPVALSDFNAGRGGGFVVNGVAREDHIGSSVASAGDLNGDGLGDLIIGGPTANSDRLDVGKTYVVFGRKSAAPVDLSSLTTTRGVVVISGKSSFDYSGSSVSAAGDVNGDGLGDLVVGAIGGNPQENWVNGQNRSTGYRAGKTYVIFGSAR